MATQKQVFTEAHENIDKANHTTSGLIEYLRYIFGKLENASGGGGGGGSEVSYTQTLASGTETGTIEIDGVATKMYAPTPTAPTEVEVTQVISTGTKIATISVDNVPTDIYAPTSGAGGSVSVTADGVKTIAQLINELYANVTHANLTPRAVLKYGDDVFPLISTNNQRDVFDQAFIQSGTMGVIRIIGKTSGSQFDQYVGSSYTDRSNDVPTSGILITLYY